MTTYRVSISNKDLTRFGTETIEANDINEVYRRVDELVLNVYSSTGERLHIGVHRGDGDIWDTQLLKGLYPNGRPTTTGANLEYLESLENEDDYALALEFLEWYGA